jgi:hypothetical protein
MKKQLILSFLIVFAVAIFAPSVVNAMDSDVVIVNVDGDEKEKKAEKSDEKKAECTDKKEKKAECTDKKAEAKKGCSAAKSGCGAK